MRGIQLGVAHASRGRAWTADSGLRDESRGARASSQERETLVGAILPEHATVVRGCDAQHASRLLVVKLAELCLCSAAPAPKLHPMIHTVRAQC